MLAIAIAGVEVVAMNVTIEGDCGRDGGERVKQDSGGGEQMSGVA